MFPRTSSLLLVFAFCVWQPVQSQDLPKPADLLEYGATLRNLDSAELASLYIDPALENRDSPSTVAAIRLALLLSYRDSGYYDLDRAIELLRAAEQDGESSTAMRSLASLLLVLGIETRTTALEHEAALAASARSAAELQSQLDEAVAELAAAREHSATLQTQLSEIVKLEHQLDRGQRNAPGSTID